jgi:hypothetical protein
LTSKKVGKKNRQFGSSYMEQIFIEARSKFHTEILWLDMFFRPHRVSQLNEGFNSEDKICKYVPKDCLLPGAVVGITM